MITEQEINNIINLMFEGIGDNKLNVRKEPITPERIYNGVTLYHRPKDATVTVGGKTMKVIDSIFTYGFNREFTSSNGGNMYGPGVYTVYNLRSSNEKAKGYGSAIIKLKFLNGYQDFLIFSEQIAQKVYGKNWRIEDQVNKIFQHNVANRILHQIYLIMHDDTCSFKDMAKSSESAYKIVTLLGEAGMNDSKCRGIVYNGGHDGGCCFIRDFSSVVPIEVSYDNGRTWKNRLNQNLINWINSEVDTHFQFDSNKEFKEVSKKAINGFTMGWNKNGKVNYIPVNSNEPISNVWFDDGSNWENKNGVLYAVVEYAGNTLNITYEDNQYMVYTEFWEPLDCTVEELPDLING